MRVFLGRDEAARFLQTKLPAKVLDVATGTGAQAYTLARLGYEVTGVDLSPEMMEQAEKVLDHKLSLRFECCDAANLPYNGNTFDAASISFGLHDMPQEIAVKVLSEMKRVTKLGGELLIVDYMEPRKHWAACVLHPLVRLSESPNYCPFVERGIDSILDEVGLKAARSTHYRGMVQIVVADNSKSGLNMRAAPQ